MRTRRAHQPRELLQRCPWLQQVCVETGQSSVLRNHSQARRIETERNRMQSVSADSCVVEGQSSERLTEGVASGQQLQKNKFPFPQRACRDSWAPQNYENHFKGPSYTQKAPQASETFFPPQAETGFHLRTEEHFSESTLGKCLACDPLFQSCLTLGHLLLPTLWLTECQRYSMGQSYFKSYKPEVHSRPLKLPMASFSFPSPSPPLSSALPCSLQKVWWGC